MRALLIGATLATAVATAFAQQPQTAAQTPQTPTTFRTGTDVVAVDVSVVDPSGRPVSDLAATDFTLKVDGSVRRIRSAEFVSLRRLDALDADRTNVSASRTPGRLIMLV